MNGRTLNIAITKPLLQRRERTTKTLLPGQIIWGKEDGPVESPEISIVVEN